MNCYKVNVYIWIVCWMVKQLSAWEMELVNKDQVPAEAIHIHLSLMLLGGGIKALIVHTSLDRYLVSWYISWHLTEKSGEVNFWTNTSQTTSTSQVVAATDSLSQIRTLYKTVTFGIVQ